MIAQAPSSAAPTSACRPGWSRRERWTAACIALLAGYAALLARSAWQGDWFVDEAGRLIPYDYVNLFSSGRLAWEGRAADAYDYAVHKAAQVRALGRAFEGYFPWPYPPHSLLIVAPFAGLPYLPSFALWVAATGAGYGAAMRAIVGSGPLGLWAMLAWPAVLWNVAVGQNGFLSAALLAGALLAIDRRPILAGLFLGLLTYKPQFGLLVPVALAAGGHWRVIGSASVTALLFAAASLVILGPEPWAAFARSLAVTHQLVMVEGQGDFAKLPTLYGIARNAGAGGTVAWSLQAILSLAAAASVAIIWRSPAAADVKAAALAVACLLATPYAYVYDLVILAIPIAFLARTGLDRIERLGVALSAALVLGSPVAPGILAFTAIVVVAWLVERRRGMAASLEQRAEDDAKARSG